MAVVSATWNSVSTLGQPHHHHPSLMVDKEEEEEEVEEEEDLPFPMSDMENSIHPVVKSPFEQLPLELLLQILSYLSAQDLARASATCRSFAEHAANDRLWASLINSYLPDKINDAGTFDSFRSLYIAHHPCWFIPQHKIWFSDTEHTGNLILARYDNRRGVIEAYRVIAERRTNHFQTWEWNPDVIIQNFHPKASLWLDDPVLFLKNQREGRPTRYLHGETRMPMPLEMQHVSNAFLLCSTELPLDPDPTKQWPPPAIPSSVRVYRDADTQQSGWDQPPRQLTQMSEHAFRIRRWAHLRMGMPIFSRGETLSTYTTLDPSLYTPTPEKPYQGIWVGDYAAHGCEFLLFMQDDPSEDPAPSPSETEPHDDGPIQRGSLKGIKLTGDPNVPRGEISFISDDIGPGGFIRVAEEALFQGSRIVRSKGHVAGLGFRDGKPCLFPAQSIKKLPNDLFALTCITTQDTFINSQLILISPDYVAHYWEAMGHITYFRRLDIDALIRT